MFREEELVQDPLGLRVLILCVVILVVTFNAMLESPIAEDGLEIAGTVNSSQ